MQPLLLNEEKSDYVMSPLSNILTNEANYFTIYYTDPWRVLNFRKSLALKGIYF